MAAIVTLQTGTGFWNPLAWCIAFAIALVFAYLIWMLGEKDPGKGGDLVRPYLSGNPEPEKSAVHLRGGNLYWGFTEALHGYYSRVTPLHSGILTDYLLWFLGVIAVVLIMVGVLA
ncbi:MAG: hydrogenase [Methanomicrobiales archaeon]|nr:hydrogenase [Methanomicrobiales archaeon]